MEDHAYRALADGQRRAVLLALIDRSSLSVSSLLSGKEFHSVALHHKHLPMLAAMGYVAWDQSSDTVARGPRFDVIRKLVEFHAAEFAGSSAAGDAGTVD
jgi:hypothetical protein